MCYADKEKFVKLELEKIKNTMRENQKYENIDLSTLKLDINLNEISNLRDIKRKIHEQIINFIVYNMEMIK